MNKKRPATFPLRLIAWLCVLIDYEENNNDEKRAKQIDRTPV